MTCIPILISSPQSKANDHCHLRVHVLPDNYVVFESVKNSGEFVAMQKNDVPPEKVKGLGMNDEMVQFFVRVQVRPKYYMHSVYVYYMYLLYHYTCMYIYMYMYMSF